MKAKEYVAMCEGLSIKTSSNEVLAKKIIEIDKMFMSEISEMMEVRGKSQKVVVGIINELDNKWKSFASKIDFVTPEMFRERLKDIDPAMMYMMNWKIN